MKGIGNPSDIELDPEIVCVMGRWRAILRPQAGWLESNGEVRT